jgi:pyruvate-formate lyase-activating enzyme
MVDEREDRQWYHTASIMAMIAEVHRDAKKHRKPYSAIQFHPMHRNKPVAPVEQVDIRILKSIFVDRPEA